MRVSAALMVLFLSAPAIAADTGPAPPASASSSAECPRTSNYLAGKGGLYRGPPLVPRKLTELPPATTYMAVFRHIGLCEVPLTLSEYRNPRRR